MRHLVTATTLAAGLAAAAVGFAGVAAAGPAGPGSASDTIAALEELGNRVVVDRRSDVPLAEASVVSVRPGADIRGSVFDAAQGRLPAATGQVVYVVVR